jgi:four helix bundle protein
MNQSPIFTRTYDLLKWLIPATVKFPRQQRFVLAASLQDAAFAFQAEIYEAVYTDQPKSILLKADGTLARLRTNLRLSHDLGLLGEGQYRHVSGMVNEIGKLLGGWLKNV